MVSREEYFRIQKEYLEFRKPQIKVLFDQLQRHISLDGDNVVSIGCGVAPEFLFLEHQNKVGLDHNPSIIDFAKSTHDATFYCMNYMEYLESAEDHSIDLILAIDIDSNIIPDMLIRLALQKLKSTGALVITEREYNIHLYGRSLLLSQMDKPKRYPADYKLLTRTHMILLREDRDNLVLIVQPSSS
jgi:hypothetical protein